MLCSSFHKMKTFFFKRKKEAPMTVEMKKQKKNKQTKQTRLMKKTRHTIFWNFLKVTVFTVLKINK